MRMRFGPRSIFMAIVVLINITFIVFSIWEVFDFRRNPGDYRFGEAMVYNGGIHYSNEVAYLLAMCWMTSLGVIGLAGFALRNDALKVAGIAAALFIVVA